MNAAASTPRGATKVALLGLLYASQGVAPGFAAFAMPVLLRRAGTSLPVIGLIQGLLLLPVALKFLCGPWSDRVAARGGLRRWMNGLQALLAVCLTGVALAPPGQSRALFIALVSASYLVVAVLDVLTDGLAVRLLRPDERPAGNGAQYGGYYLGSVLGSLFLVVEPTLGWVPAVGLLGLVVASGWIAVWRLAPAVSPGHTAARHPAAVVAALDTTPAPNFTPAAPLPARAVSSASLLAFLRGPVARHVLPLLLLLDLPQNVGIAPVSTFLVDLRLSQAQAGLASLIGLFGAVAGAAAAGALLSRLSRVTALVTTGALQALPLLAFVWLAVRGEPDLVMASVVVTAAYFTASAFNVALSSWFMDRLAADQPSTDYSIMACAHTLTFVVANPIAGGTAGALGFGRHFAWAGTCSLLLLAAAVPWLRWLQSRRPPAPVPNLATA
jgi:PAT family beta-lactamase induction signal transducer AmpG